MPSAKWQREARRAVQESIAASVAEARRLGRHPNIRAIEKRWQQSAERVERDANDKGIEPASGD